MVVGLDTKTDVCYEGIIVFTPVEDKVSPIPLTVKKKYKKNEYYWELKRKCL